MIFVVTPLSGGTWSTTNEAAASNLSGIASDAPFVHSGSNGKIGSGPDAEFCAQSSIRVARKSACVARSGRIGRRAAETRSGLPASVATYDGLCAGQLATRTASEEV